MEHESEELIEELKKVINADDIVRESGIGDNIFHSVFVFINYSPKNSQKPISIILPCDLSGNRLWMTVKDSQLKKINAQKPKYHGEYERIQYRDSTYYPYSVIIEQVPFEPNVVKEILEQTYAHYNGNDA